jgi:hypothetical protein
MSPGGATVGSQGREPLWQADYDGNEEALAAARGSHDLSAGETKW